MPHKAVTLKIEHFYQGEDVGFRISSVVEMLAILQGIAARRSRVALFYGGDREFVLSTVLDADEQGLWLDAGPFPEENQRLLRSGKIVFVSVHQQVKIQFTIHHIESETYAHHPAFYMKLPDHLLRIQRRENFRIDVPASSRIECIIPIPPKNPDDPIVTHSIPVVDISGGGIGLLCDRHEAALLPNQTFRDCRISLTDVGALTETIEVRFNIDLATSGDAVHERVGCRFVRMDNRTDALLQRHLAHLQSESIARQRMSVGYAGKHFQPTMVLLGLDLTPILAVLS